MFSGRAFWTNSSRKLYFLAPKPIEPPMRRRRTSTMAEMAVAGASSTNLLDLVTAIKTDVGLVCSL